MRATIIVESCFGNTDTIAQALAEGLRGADVETELIAVGEAPPRVASDLVLIAAPTHNMGLSKPQTRQQATDKGATSQHTTGVREWIDGVQFIEGRILTVSTTTGGMMAGSAGKAAVKALRRKKITAEHGEDFTVSGTEGPLAEAAADQARAWAASLISG